VTSLSIGTLNALVLLSRAGNEFAAEPSAFFAVSRERGHEATLVLLAKLGARLLLG